MRAVVNIRVFNFFYTTLSFQTLFDFEGRKTEKLVQKSRVARQKGSELSRRRRHIYCTRQAINARVHNDDKTRRVADAEARRRGGDRVHMDSDSEDYCLVGTPLECEEEAAGYKRKVKDLALTKALPVHKQEPVDEEGTP